MDEWVRSHVYDVPAETRSFCGELLECGHLLNVGCGEMLADLGLLTVSSARITGLDVNPVPDFPHALIRRVRAEGVDVPENAADRLSFVQYDGTHFPFPDASFDFVFSWSAFEHIADIDAVLREMHRVLKPGMHAFVQVFPWYASRQGSHLTPWIDERFFHLTRDFAWVEDQMAERVKKEPGFDWMARYMVREFKSLNRISPSHFYEAARDAGFQITKARLISYDEDLTDVPRGVSFADLMIAGTMMLLRREASPVHQTFVRNVVPPVAKRIAVPSLQTLLLLDGEEFVTAAYATILDRAPDSGGLENYLMELRAGASKLAIISRLRNSAEGRRQNRHLVGYRKALIWSCLGRLSTFFRWGAVKG